MDMKTPSSSAPAVKEAITSGAPLENASKVTPATVSGSLRSCEILARSGLKYVSAVFDYRLKHIANSMTVISRVIM